MLATGVRHAESSLRLTRRGRVVLTAVFLVLFLLPSVVLFASATRG